MPVPVAGERGGEARAWLDRQEEADRKNARVIDKVTIALPRELNAVQRVELVRAFAAEDADNPHAHVVLRDRDLETGKMALRMSQSGSTEMLRGTWERVCNAALERAGMDERIDRRTLEARASNGEPQGSWKIAALTEERAAAHGRLRPVVERAAGFLARAGTLAKNLFGRNSERSTDRPQPAGAVAIPRQKNLEPQEAADGRTPEGLKQIRALAGRTLDMLDGINALPERQDRPKERMREAVEAPERPVEAPRAVEALSGARAIIEAAQRAREAAQRERDAREATAGPERPAQDPFARYRAQSRDDYLLTKSAEEYQEVIYLLKTNTTDAQYDRFRRGDLSAIAHITSEPVFSRQLLMLAELDNRSTGFRMGHDLERLMSDNRDFLAKTFETDRDRGYEHER
ncbi:hypothetical protein PHISP_08186 [Aspergillus sp. HF37]|nr:hypothetical protein PHISP_08186 [Aspergillus sp. HF37]